MKKFLVSVFILAIFAGAVFYFGWVQFALPAGYTGVMVSKTGGVNPAPVAPGEFRWAWERLLPTNCKIIAFSLSPVELTVNASGALASADLYARFLEGSPDFSYSISANLSVRAVQQDLPLIVEEYGIGGEDELSELLEKAAQRAFYSAAEKYIAAEAQKAARLEEGAIAPGLPDTSGIASLFEDELPEWIAQVSFSVTQALLPDFALYAEGSSIYGEYALRRREAAIAAAVNAAEAEIASAEQMRLFAEWGSFLEKFPSLIDFLAVARDDATDTLELLRDLKGGASPSP